MDQRQDNAAKKSDGNREGEPQADSAKPDADDEIDFHHPRWEKLHPELRDKVANTITIGHLVYWASVLLAAIALILGAITVMNPENDDNAALSFFVAAPAIWLLGRVLRYLLSGR